RKDSGCLNKDYLNASRTMHYHKDVVCLLGTQFTMAIISHQNLLRFLSHLKPTKPLGKTLD
ncbi:hypothetical protein, partial [Legionella cherrii]|uniref:hypothetical protein n=1 Tax=Legionella cherrii TaxID=28084 RepID=UPI001ED9A900